MLQDKPRAFDAGWLSRQQHRTAVSLSRGNPTNGSSRRPDTPAIDNVDTSPSLLPRRSPALLDRLSQESNHFGAPKTPKHSPHHAVTNSRLRAMSMQVSYWPRGKQSNMKNILFKIIKMAGKRHLAHLLLMLAMMASLYPFFSTKMANGMHRDLYSLMDSRPRLLPKYSLHNVLAASDVYESAPSSENYSAQTPTPSDMDGMVQGTATRQRSLALEELPNEDSWLLSPSDRTTFSDGIPRVVNKLFFGNDGQFEVNMDAKLRNAHDSWTTMNPGYRIRYFDLLTARKYLQQFFHPVFIRAFDCLQAFAMKSDLARIAILYREGGWHSDWKQVCLQQNLLDGISNETDFFASIDEAGPGGRCVSNGFIGASPRHATIGKYLKLILTNIQKRHYGSSPIHPSGPCAFGEIMDNDRYASLGAYRHSVEGRKYSGSFYYWKGQSVILHKCNGCGDGQDWRAGNNYNKLWRQKKSYCEDAPSIFQV